MDQERYKNCLTPPWNNVVKRASVPAKSTFFPWTKAQKNWRKSRLDSFNNEFQTKMGTSQRAANSFAKSIHVPQPKEEPETARRTMAGPNVE
jgi:hypothetical protein